MTIRQNGGVFGRHPEFQTATVKGDLLLGTALQFEGGARLTSTVTYFTVDRGADIQGTSRVNSLRLGRATGNTSETNTVFGFSAMPQSGYTGTESTAIGWGAMFSSTGNAYQNTAVGRSALFGNTSGWQNVAVGVSAGSGNTSGKNNTFLGAGAGGITTGSNNIVIGRGATASATTVSNETTIGNSSTTKARIFGDIVLQDGKGIDFSATAGTGTSELFDDYEEGSFTPNIQPASGSITWLAGSDTLSYTKIGRVVHIFGLLAVDSVSTPSGITRGSLPFTNLSLPDQQERSAGGGLIIQGTSLPANSFGFYPNGGSDSFLELVRLNTATISRDVGSYLGPGDWVIIAYSYLAA